MNRLVALAVIPSLMFATAATADDFGIGNFFVLDFAPAEYCPQPVRVEVQCETPVVAAPRLRTVRRVVPRTTYHTVTKTIMVPSSSLETRQTQSVEYRDEVRERSVIVYEQVPETKQITTERTVLVPETRHRTETFHVQVPTVRTVPQNVTVHSVQIESRTGIRRIARDVPAVELRTVVTGGDVVRRGVASDHGGVKASAVIVGGCEKQVAVPVTKRQIIEQTFEYDVEVARPVTSTRMIQQTEYRTEARTRSVPVVVQVPKIQTHTQEVTELKSVPRQTTETYTERVPHVVTRDFQVPVTKLVAKIVTEQVPVTTYDVIEEVVCD